MIAIPEDKIAAAQAMLDSGAGSRRVSTALGLTRYAVELIRDGEYGRRDQRGRMLEPPRRDGTVSRCPGCGGMVLKPCWLCHVRAEKYGTSGEPQFAGRA